MVFEVLYCSRLLLNAILEILFMESIDTKPAWNRGWVDVQIVDKQRTAKWQYLYDKESFKPIGFTP